MACVVVVAAAAAVAAAVAAAGGGRRGRCWPNRQRLLLRQNGGRLLGGTGTGATSTTARTRAELQRQVERFLARGDLLEQRGRHERCHVAVGLLQVERRLGELRFRVDAVIVRVLVGVEAAAATAAQRAAQRARQAQQVVDLRADAGQRERVRRHREVAGPHRVRAGLQRKERTVRDEARPGREREQPERHPGAQRLVEVVAVRPKTRRPTRSEQCERVPAGGTGRTRLTRLAKLLPLAGAGRLLLRLLLLLLLLELWLLRPPFGGFCFARFCFFSGAEGPARSARLAVQMDSGGLASGPSGNRSPRRAARPVLLPARPPVSDEDEDDGSLMSGVLGIALACSSGDEKSRNESGPAPGGEASSAAGPALSPPCSWPKNAPPGAGLRCFLPSLAAADAISSAGVCGGDLSSSITITSRSGANGGTVAAGGSAVGARCPFPSTFDFVPLFLPDPECLRGGSGAGDVVISRLGCIFCSSESWAACSDACSSPFGCLPGAFCLRGFAPSPSGARAPGISSFSPDRAAARHGSMSGGGWFGPAPAGTCSSWEGAPSVCWSPPACSACSFFACFSRLVELFTFGCFDGAGAGGGSGGSGGCCSLSNNSGVVVAVVVAVAVVVVGVRVMASAVGNVGPASAAGGGGSTLRFFSTPFSLRTFVLDGFTGLPGTVAPSVGSVEAALNAAGEGTPPVAADRNGATVATLGWPVPAAASTGGRTADACSALHSLPSPAGSSPTGGGGFALLARSPPGSFSPFSEFAPFLSPFLRSRSVGFFFTFLPGCLTDDEVVPVAAAACTAKVLPTASPPPGGGVVIAVVVAETPPCLLEPLTDDAEAETVCAETAPTPADTGSAAGGAQSSAGGGCRVRGGRSSGMIGMRESGSLPSRAGEINPDVVMITLLMLRVGLPSPTVAPALLLPPAASPCAANCRSGSACGSGRFALVASGSPVVPLGAPSADTGESGGGGGGGSGVGAGGPCSETASLISSVCIGISTSSFTSASGASAPSSPSTTGSLVSIFSPVSSMVISVSVAPSSTSFSSPASSTVVGRLAPDASPTRTSAFSSSWPGSPPSARSTSSSSGNIGGMYMGMCSGRIIISRLPGFRKFRFDSRGSGKRGTANGSAMGSTNWMYSISSCMLMPMSR
uniref:Uncharacterized protein n=1 Tax=Anopheles atroparvus TaxID=41427 RepID=A0A182IKG1_ANOAO